MRVRMVPFASLSERLYRIVRQTAKEIEKRANLELKGTQVELDRSVLEHITGPFEHLLRNAVTHGIETPAERVAPGKPEIGEIRIEVRQEGNEVVLAIADDGRRAQLRAHPREGLSRRAAQARGRAVRSRDRASSSSTRASRPPPRSPSSPAAASAWTWSRTRSPRSAAASSSRARPGTGRPSRSICRSRSR